MKRSDVFLSGEDGGKIWPVARVVDAGPAAYSDLAVVPDGQILCLYERGGEHPYQTLTLARIAPQWLIESPQKGTPA